MMVFALAVLLAVVLGFAAGKRVGVYQTWRSVQPLLESMMVAVGQAIDSVEDEAEVPDHISEQRVRAPWQ
jgi:hypothetical protein